MFGVFVVWGCFLVCARVCPCAPPISGGGGAHVHGSHQIRFLNACARRLGHAFVLVRALWGVCAPLDPVRWGTSAAWLVWALR